MAKRKTAGELSLKAASDKTKYDPLEVAHAKTDDVMPNIIECAERHKAIFDETEYFVCMCVASDPLIKGIERHKYFALLYLPSPRPQQICFLYNKITQRLKRLWTLPNAMQMAILSEMTFVDEKWKKTKGWVDAFFDRSFWHHIRKENNIDHLSEIEYLNLHRDKLIQAGAKEFPPPDANPFDFSKVKIDHIIDTKTAHA
jgi:hypothetical protein